MAASRNPKLASLEAKVRRFCAAISSVWYAIRGRFLAITLGLTPPHHGSGGKEKLLGISKRQVHPDAAAPWGTLGTPYRV
jgi:hypothetical protein